MNVEDGRLLLGLVNQRALAGARVAGGTSRIAS
jgi:hypothetical protein